MSGMDRVNKGRFCVFFEHLIEGEDSKFQLFELC